jgi:hypothetical protein
MAKKSASDVVNEAQTELVNINARLSDSSARRDKLLLDGDEKALDAIEAEVANLQKAHERQVDRIRLLEAEAEREQADATLKRRQEHVARFTKKLADADQVADQLQATIEQADKLFRKLIELREDARVSWWGSTPHENALAVSPDGAALSGIAVKALVMHEIYRVGARPFVGGSPGELKQADFPGGQSPRHELLGQPDKIEPLGARMRRASKAAIEVMKGKIPDGAVPDTPSAPPPSGNGTPPAANGDQATLAALLYPEARHRPLTELRARTQSGPFYLSFLLQLQDMLSHDLEPLFDELTEKRIMLLLG